MKLLTSFGDIKNLLSKMIFCNKTNVNARKICYNHISITGSDFLERSILTLMLDHKSEEDYMDISGLNDLEKAILFDFQLLSEDEQKSILEFILSLLGK